LTNNFKNVLAKLDIEEIRLIFFLEYGAYTRQEICDKLHWPRSTTFDRGIKLIEKDLVEKSPKWDGKRGRDKVYWRLTEDGCIFLDRLRGSEDLERIRRSLESGLARP